MARNIITGIDVGTRTTRIVVSEYTKGAPLPRIIGTSEVETHGLRHGYIVNHLDASKTVKKAISIAQKSANLHIQSAFISVSGISLESVISTGSVSITRADSSVTSFDIEKATSDAEEGLQNMANKKIIDRIAIKYKLDGKEVLGYPEGMSGTKLEIKVLFITCLENHLQDLVQTIEEAGVEVEYVIPSPIAASLVALSKRQRTVGCVLANIGAETVSIVVFEEDVPISLKVFTIGSNDITNDIALGLQIPLEEAEFVKHKSKDTDFPKKKLDEIIDARLSDIFDLIDSHLKKIGRNGLLPAGIILTGGGAGISTIEDFAKSALKLPSSKVLPSLNGPSGKDQVKDSSWFVAYGLCIFGATQERESHSKIALLGIGRSITTWLKSLMP